MYYLHGMLDFFLVIWMNILGLVLFILTWKSVLTTHAHKFHCSSQWIVLFFTCFYWIKKFGFFPEGTQKYSPSHSGYSVLVLSPGALTTRHFVSPTHLRGSDQTYWFFGIIERTFSRLVAFCCGVRIFYSSNTTIKFMCVQSHNGILLVKDKAQLVSFQWLIFFWGCW